MRQFRVAFRVGAVALAALCLFAPACGSDNGSGPADPDAGDTPAGETDGSARADGAGEASADAGSKKDGRADSGGPKSDGSSSDADDDDANNDGGGASGDGGSADGGASDGASASDGNASDGNASDGSASDGSTSDGSVGPSDSGVTACKAHSWRAAVPGAGDGIMAFGSKTYLFATSGTAWTIFEAGAATVQAIPYPSGITEMKNAVVEMSPSGRPLVLFSNGASRYATFWNGSAFQKTMLLGTSVGQAHADASERVYAIVSGLLTEHQDGASPIVRGAMPNGTNEWTVAANGTVHQLYTASLNAGNRTELHITRLARGALSWVGNEQIVYNAGYGFNGVRVAAAPDGSLHLAYPFSEFRYFRSRDGAVWEDERAANFSSEAVLVDPATATSNDDPVEVKGSIRVIGALDYDHVAIALSYNGGSFSIPGVYLLRRCSPLLGFWNVWPAERFAFLWTLNQPPLALNQYGVASVMTPAGMRQEQVP